MDKLLYAHYLNVDIDELENALHATEPYDKTILAPMNWADATGYQEDRFAWLNVFSEVPVAITDADGHGFDGYLTIAPDIGVRFTPSPQNDGTGRIDFTHPNTD